MSTKEPTRKHIISESGEKWGMRWPFRAMLLIPVVLGGLVLVGCLIVFLMDLTDEATTVTAKSNRTNSQREEINRIEERPVKRKSEELFPVEEIKVLENSSSVWSLIGTVRNTTEHPVKGIVIIRFLDKTGYVFHKSQSIVVGPKGMQAIQTGKIPLLPEPEWIRPGEFGWFIHPEDYIVFEEAADIEVTFKKINS